MRNVCGLWPLMVSHHASVSLRRSACGTHLLMRPIATASFAVKRRAQKIISRSSRSRMMRGRYCVAPTVGQAPTRAPVWPSTAFSEAMTRSHHKASSWPPPMHQPLTMAMTGIGRLRMVMASHAVVPHGAVHPGEALHGVEVAAGGKSLVAGAGHDRTGDGGVLARGFQRVDELIEGLLAKGVEDARPVDGRPRDLIGDLVENIAVVPLVRAT